MTAGLMSLRENGLKWEWGGPILRARRNSGTDENSWMWVAVAEGFRGGEDKSSPLGQAGESSLWRYSLSAGQHSGSRELRGMILK